MDGDVFGEVAERIRRSTVQLRGSKNSGSGVLWGTDGKILTNAHVLREGAARVEFWNGRQTPARVLKSDRLTSPSCRPKPAACPRPSTETQTLYAPANWSLWWEVPSSNS